MPNGPANGYFWTAWPELEPPWADFRDEGSVWLRLKQPEGPYCVPVIRFWDNGQHFWTADLEHELLQTPPWTETGNRYFVFREPVAGSIPVYRWFDGRRNHFWTTDPKGEDAAEFEFHPEPHGTAAPGVPKFHVYPATHALGENGILIRRYSNLPPKWCVPLVWNGNVVERKTVRARSSAEAKQAVGSTIKFMEGTGMKGVMAGVPEEGACRVSG